MMNNLNALLKHNLMAKLLAVLAAAVLWVFVMNEQNPAVNNNFSVKVYTPNIPDGYRAVLSEDEQYLRLKVRAPRSMMASANAEDFYAYVDVGNAKEGLNRLKVQAHVPTGFEAVSLSDEYINVILEPIIVRDVNVYITTSGELADNVILKNVRPEQSKMTIKGPSSIVGSVDHLVGVVEFSGENTDFRTSVSVLPVNKDGLAVEGVTMFDSNMAVNVELEKKVIKKDVVLNVITSGELPKDLVISSIKIVPDKVEVFGDEADLKDLSKIDTVAVELNKIKESCIIDVGLNLPAGVKSANGTVKVDVAVKKK